MDGTFDITELRHTGTVWDYVKELTSLMLDVPDIFEKEKLFNFQTGLQQWAQIEVRRQGG